MSTGWVKLGYVAAISEESFNDAIEDERVYPVWGPHSSQRGAQEWAAVLRIVHRALADQPVSS